MERGWDLHERIVNNETNHCRAAAMRQPFFLNQRTINNLHHRLQGKKNIMNATQTNTMNTELWQSIGAIADNEPLMRRLTRYAKKLAKEKNDPTLMSKEEFFAKLEKAEQQIADGKYSVLLPGEDLTTHLRRLGYEI